MYRGETCDECGMAVAFFTRSYWKAPDVLWNEVMGTDAGTLCPPCFTLAARAKGISIHWQAVGPPTPEWLDDAAILKTVSERDAADTGERLTIEELEAQVDEPPTEQPDFWRPTGECPEC